MLMEFDASVDKVDHENKSALDYAKNNKKVVRVVCPKFGHPAETLGIYVKLKYCFFLKNNREKNIYFFFERWFNVVFVTFRT